MAQSKKTSLNLRILSSIVVVCFMTTNQSTASAFAARVNSIPISHNTLPINLANIQVSEQMGKTQEIFKGIEDVRVILIQDAHAIPEAQRNIQRLIDYFQKNYGVDLVTLEGASSKLDGEIIKSFPDKEILHQVLEEYHARGELAGGTAAALLNESKSIYQGIEDWNLYEEGLSLYEEATQKEQLVSEKIGALQKALEEKKLKVYSKPLLKVDQLLENFYRNNSNLLEVLNELSKTQKPQKGSELALILEESNRHSAKNETAEREVKEFAEKIRSLLPHRGYPDPKEKIHKMGLRGGLKGRRSNLRSEIASLPSVARNDEMIFLFNQKYQEFQTSKLTPQAFALFLKDVITEYGFQLPISNQLAELMKNQKRLQDIQGTKFFEDFERYVSEVKEALFRNNNERAIDLEGQNLRLLERFASLELSHEDWEHLNNLISSLRAPKGRSNLGDRFVASLLAMTDELKANFKFYEVAVKRDKMLFENLEKLMTHEKKKMAIVVTGGFHTQGLTQQFKARGISYLLLMPHMDSIPEHTNYRAQMRGDVSWKNYFKAENGRVNLYKAFMRGTRDRLLSVSKTDKNTLLKSWRDQIIRDLAERNELTKVQRYTQFIDEVGGKNFEDQWRNKWLANIDRFVDGLNQLNAKGLLNEPNVFKLLKPSTSISTAGPVVLTEGASVATPIVKGWDEAELMKLPKARVHAEVPSASKPGTPRSLNRPDLTAEVRENFLQRVSTVLSRLPRPRISPLISAASFFNSSLVFRRSLFNFETAFSRWVTLLFMTAFVSFTISNLSELPWTSISSFSNRLSRSPWPSATILISFLIDSISVPTSVTVNSGLWLSLWGFSFFMTNLLFNDFVRKEGSEIIRPIFQIVKSENVESTSRAEARAILTPEILIYGAGAITVGAVAAGTIWKSMRAQKPQQVEEIKPEKVEAVMTPSEIIRQNLRGLLKKTQSVEESEEAFNELKKFLKSLPPTFFEMIFKGVINFSNEPNLDGKLDVSVKSHQEVYKLFENFFWGVANHRSKSIEISKKAMEYFKKLQILGKLIAIRDQLSQNNNFDAVENTKVQVAIRNLNRPTPNETEINAARELANRLFLKPPQRAELRSTGNNSKGQISEDTILKLKTQIEDYFKTRLPLLKRLTEQKLKRLFSVEGTLKLPLIAELGKDMSGDIEKFFVKFLNLFYQLRERFHHQGVEFSKLAEVSNIYLGAALVTYAKLIELTKEMKTDNEAEAKLENYLTMFKSGGSRFHILIKSGYPPLSEIGKKLFTFSIDTILDRIEKPSIESLQIIENDLLNAGSLIGISKLEFLQILGDILLDIYQVFLETKFEIVNDLNQFRVQDIPEEAFFLALERYFKDISKTSTQPRSLPVSAAPSPDVSPEIPSMTSSVRKEVKELLNQPGVPLTTRQSKSEASQKIAKKILEAHGKEGHFTTASVNNAFTGAGIILAPGMADRFATQLQKKFGRAEARITDAKEIERLRDKLNELVSIEAGPGFLLDRALTKLKQITPDNRQEAIRYAQIIEAYFDLNKLESSSAAAPSEFVYGDKNKTEKKTIDISLIFEAISRRLAVSEANSETLKPSLRIWVNGEEINTYKLQPLEVKTGDHIVVEIDHSRIYNLIDQLKKISKEASAQEKSAISERKSIDRHVATKGQAVELIKSLKPSSNMAQVSEAWNFINEHPEYLAPSIVESWAERHKNYVPTRQNKEQHENEDTAIVVALEDPIFVAVLEEFQKRHLEHLKKSPSEEDINKEEDENKKNDLRNLRNKWRNLAADFTAHGIRWPQIYQPKIPSELFFGGILADDPSLARKALLQNETIKLPINEEWIKGIQPARGLPLIDIFRNTLKKAGYPDPESSVEFKKVRGTGYQVNITFQKLHRFRAELRTTESEIWEKEIRLALEEKRIRDAIRLYTNHQKVLDEISKRQLKIEIYQARQKFSDRAELRNLVDDNTKIEDIETVRFNDEDYKVFKPLGIVRDEPGANGLPDLLVSEPILLKPTKKGKSIYLIRSQLNNLTYKPKNPDHSRAEVRNAVPEAITKFREAINNAQLQPNFIYFAPDKKIRIEKPGSMESWRTKKLIEDLGKLNIRHLYTSDGTFMWFYDENGIISNNASSIFSRAEARTQKFESEVSEASGISQEELIHQGEILWLKIKNKDTSLETKRKVDEWSGINFGASITLDGVTLADPWRNAVSGEVDLREVFTKPWYALPEVSLKELRSYQPISYYDLSEEEIQSLMAYLLSRPDRYLARVNWPAFMGSTLIKPGPDYWRTYYGGRYRSADSLSGKLKLQHPFIAEKIVRVVELLAKSNQQTKFNLLQDGAGDAALLLKVREELKKKFPKFEFHFYGVDQVLKWILEHQGEKIDEKDVTLITGNSADPGLLGLENPNDFFDVVFDFGLLNGPTMGKKEAEKIFRKWSDQLKPGGIAVSVQTAQSFWHELSPAQKPANLQPVAYSVPENLFAGKPPASFVVLQKQGGIPLQALDLFADSSRIMNQPFIPRAETRSSLRKKIGKWNLFFFSSVIAFGSILAYYSFRDDTWPTALLASGVITAVYFFGVGALLLNLERKKNPRAEVRNQTEEEIHKKKILTFIRTIESPESQLPAKLIEIIQQLGKEVSSKYGLAHYERRAIRSLDGLVSVQSPDVLNAAKEVLKSIRLSIDSHRAEVRANFDINKRSLVNVLILKVDDNPVYQAIYDHLLAKGYSRDRVQLVPLEKLKDYKKPSHIQHFHWFMQPGGIDTFELMMHGLLDDVNLLKGAKPIGDIIQLSDASMMERGITNLEARIPEWFPNQFRAEARNSKEEIVPDLPIIFDGRTKKVIPAQTPKVEPEGYSNLEKFIDAGDHSPIEYDYKSKEVRAEVRSVVESWTLQDSQTLAKRLPGYSFHLRPAIEHKVFVDVVIPQTPEAKQFSFLLPERHPDLEALIGHLNRLIIYQHKRDLFTRINEGFQTSVLFGFVGFGAGWLLGFTRLGLWFEPEHVGLAFAVLTGIEGFRAGFNRGFSFLRLFEGELNEITFYREAEKEIENFIYRIQYSYRAEARSSRQEAKRQNLIAGHFVQELIHGQIPAEDDLNWRGPNLLMDVLKNENAVLIGRRKAALALGKLGKRASEKIKSLIPLLENSSINSTIREAIANALGDIGDESTIPILENITKRFDSSDALKRSSRDAIKKIKAALRAEVRSDAGLKEAKGHLLNRIGLLKHKLKYFDQKVLEFWEITVANPVEKQSRKANDFDALILQVLKRKDKPIEKPYDVIFMVKDKNSQRSQYLSANSSIELVKKVDQLFNSRISTGETVVELLERWRVSQTSGRAEARSHRTKKISSERNISIDDKKINNLLGIWKEEKFTLEQLQNLSNGYFNDRYIPSPGSPTYQFGEGLKQALFGSNGGPENIHERKTLQQFFGQALKKFSESEILFEQLRERSDYNRIKELVQAKNGLTTISDFTRVWDIIGPQIRDEHQRQRIVNEVIGLILEDKTIPRAEARMQYDDEDFKHAAILKGNSREAEQDFIVHQEVKNEEFIFHYLLNHARLHFIKANDLVSENKVGLKLPRYWKVSYVSRLISEAVDRQIHTGRPVVVENIDRRWELVAFFKDDQKESLFVLFPSGGSSIYQRMDLILQKVARGLPLDSGQVSFLRDLTFKRKVSKDILQFMLEDNLEKSRIRKIFGKRTEQANRALNFLRQINFQLSNENPLELSMTKSGHGSYVYQVVDFGIWQYTDESKMKLLSNKPSNNYELLRLASGVFQRLAKPRYRKIARAEVRKNNINDRQIQTSQHIANHVVGYFSGNASSLTRAEVRKITLFKLDLFIEQIEAAVKSYENQERQTTNNKFEEMNNWVRSESRKLTNNLKTQLSKKEKASGIVGVIVPDHIGVEEDTLIAQFLKIIGESNIPDVGVVGKPSSQVSQIATEIRRWGKHPIPGKKLSVPGIDYPIPTTAFEKISNLPKELLGFSVDRESLKGMDSVSQKLASDFTGLVAAAATVQAAVILAGETPQEYNPDKNNSDAVLLKRADLVVVNQKELLKRIITALKLDQRIANMIQINSDQTSGLGFTIVASVAAELMKQARSEARVQIAA